MGGLEEIDELEEILPLFREIASVATVEMARHLIEIFNSGGKLLLCGNGGSAADCQHMAAELVSSFTLGLKRPALPAVALTTDTSVLTAFANDYSFSGVFARQVEALGNPGDGLLCISTSGNSQNVLEAARLAASRGVTVMALTGELPNRLSSLADLTISVPSRNTQLVQTLHLVVEHAICRLIEETFQV